MRSIPSNFALITLAHNSGYRRLAVGFIRLRVRMESQEACGSIIAWTIQVRLSRRTISTLKPRHHANGIAYFVKHVPQDIYHTCLYIFGRHLVAFSIWFSDNETQRMLNSTASFLPTHLTLKLWVSGRIVVGICHHLPERDIFWMKHWILNLKKCLLLYDLLWISRAIYPRWRMFRTRIKFDLFD